MVAKGFGMAWQEFNAIYLDEVVPDDEIILMIDHAYDVVLAKFPQYIQREILEGI